VGRPPDDGVAHRRALARPVGWGRRALAPAWPGTGHVGGAAGRTVPCEPRRARPDRNRGGRGDRRGVRLQSHAGGLHLPLRQRAGVRAPGPRARVPVRGRPRPCIVRRAAPAHGVRHGAAAGRRLGCVRRPAGRALRRARRVLVRLPRAVHAGRSVPGGVCRRVRGGQLPRGRRHEPGHLDLGGERPDRLGVDRQPAFGCRGRLRLVRPGRSPRGATAAAVLVAISPRRQNAPASGRPAVDAR
jgi:hypothetical protein